MSSGLTFSAAFNTVVYSIGKITMNVMTNGAVTLLNHINTSSITEIVGKTRTMTVIGANAFLTNTDIVDKEAMIDARTKAIKKLRSVLPSVLPIAV